MGIVRCYDSPGKYEELLSPRDFHYCYGNYPGEEDKLGRSQLVLLQNLLLYPQDTMFLDLPSITEKIRGDWYT